MSSEDFSRKKKRPSDLSLPPTGRPNEVRPISPITPPVQPSEPRNLNEPRKPKTLRHKKGRSNDKSSSNPKRNRRGMIQGNRTKTRNSQTAKPRQTGTSAKMRPFPTRVRPLRDTSVGMVRDRKPPQKSSFTASQRIEPAPKPHKPRTLSQWLVLYGMRLMIVSIGAGAIAGTLISTLDSTRQAMVKQQNITSEPPQQKTHPLITSKSFPLGEELPVLTEKIQEIIKDYSQYEFGILFLDLDTGDYVNIDATKAFSAASTIKMPILVAFFEEVDRGKIRLDESLEMSEDVIVGEAGTMQYSPPGTNYSALETVQKMIIISDNTATNMIIKRLGGIQAVNRRFAQWGLTETVLKQPLPDVEGTNKTSPADLAQLMVLVSQGELVDLRSRDRLLNLMSQVENRELLPQGLEPGASIAHKTGNIGELVGDVGLIDTPTGKRYLAAVMVKRPNNDQQAKVLIQQISQAAYEYFNQPTPNPDTTNTPIETEEAIAQFN